MSIKTFFQNLFSWLHKVVKAADKAINDLSPELQHAFEVGSGVVDTINTMIDSTPDVVKEALLKRFPNLTEDDVKLALQKAANGLKIGSEINGIEDLIAAVQVNLSKIRGFDGSVWAKTSSFLSKLIAQAFAPEGTKSNIFELLMETFYQTRVKTTS